MKSDEQKDGKNLVFEPIYSLGGGRISLPELSSLAQESEGAQALLKRGRRLFIEARFKEAIGPSEGALKGLKLLEVFSSSEGGEVFRRRPIQGGGPSHLCIDQETQVGGGEGKEGQAGGGFRP